MPVGLIEKVRDTVRKHRMLAPGDTVVAAVSGGVDSMVMLRLLLSFRDELSLNIVVAHLDHNLRAGESRRDFDFVKSAASSSGLVFVGKRLKKGSLKGGGESLQAAAREARYLFLEEAAAKHGATRIALGHNLDDQAETLLMRLLKGSSLAGLAGIPPARGPFIRPLIEVPRAAIDSFARKNRIGHVTDSSNGKTVYLRNSVRLRLIPYLGKNYNPGMVDALGRTARILRQDEDFISQAADALLSASLKRSCKDAVDLDRVVLAKAHPAVSSRVLLKAVAMIKKGFALYSAHFESFSSLVRGDSPNASITLPGSISLIREYDRITVTVHQQKPSKPVRFDRALKFPGTTPAGQSGACISATVLDASKLTGSELKKGADAACFDLDAVAGQLRIRPYSPGDRLTPFGMKGTRKLKDIFIEKKIPPADRPGVPVLYSKDMGILWAAGVRRSDLARVDGSTKRVLKVEYIRIDANHDNPIPAAIS